MMRAPLAALIGALCLGSAAACARRPAGMAAQAQRRRRQRQRSPEQRRRQGRDGVYGKAARVLPDAPGLMLDRGIAQLKQGDFAKSRESLLAATVPNASSDVRADAYHNLSLSFYREADGLAEKNHGDAQKMFRESVDAAKRSLHLRPSDPNTAWNLELASRRMREEEQKKKEEDEQKEKDKKDKDQQKQDQQRPRSAETARRSAKQRPTETRSKRSGPAEQGRPARPKARRPAEARA